MAPALRAAPSRTGRLAWIFFAMAALSEPMGYLKLAKLHHKQLGTFKSDYSHAVSRDIFVTYWVLNALIAKISEGTNI